MRFFVLVAVKAMWTWQRGNMVFCQISIKQLTFPLVERV